MKIHNCSCGVRAWEELTQYGIRIWTIASAQLRVLELLCDDLLHVYHYSRSVHPFPEETPLRKPFYEWQRHLHAANEFPSHTSLWAYETGFATFDVCKIHKSPVGAGVTLTLSANMIIGSALSGWVRQVHCNGSLTVWLIKAIGNFLETVLLWLIEDLPLPMG
jgi:hypothetical protein